MAPDRYRHIFLFTGQGSQYRGMGRSLYRTEPVFRDWMDELDRVPRRPLSFSVTDFLYPPEGAGEDLEPFDRTLFSHPALFMVQFALAKTLVGYGISPDCLLGASLGEYVALSLSGAVPPQTMLESLISHARRLEATCTPGAMVGIDDRPERYERDPVIRENTSLACASSPGHFVVSGEKGQVERVILHLEETGTSFHRLPIRFGFHSPNIEPAVSGWRETLAKTAILPERPEPDVISCCTGRPLDTVSFDHLMDIGRGPIRFRDALKTLNDELNSRNGVRSSKSVNIIDLGPGGYSSGFVRQNRILDRRIRIYRVMTLFGNETRNFKKIKTELISS